MKELYRHPGMPLAGIQKVAIYSILDFGYGYAGMT